MLVYCFLFLSIIQLFIVLFKFEFSKTNLLCSLEAKVKKKYVGKCCKYNFINKCL